MGVDSPEHEISIPIQTQINYRSRSLGKTLRNKAQGLFSHRRAHLKLFWLLGHVFVNHTCARFLAFRRLSPNSGSRRVVFELKAERGIRDPTIYSRCRESQYSGARATRSISHRCSHRGTGYMYGKQVTFAFRHIRLSFGSDPASQYLT